MNKHLLSITLLIIFKSLINESFCADVIVKTRNGSVRDKTVAYDNYKIHEFIAIRYGKPPIGDLRFAKPKAVEIWDGIYDATTIRYSCWQLPFFGEAGVPRLNMSEDCLFLNIWTPSHAHLNGTGADSDLLPVMFWIHGGGLTEGSSFYSYYNGTPLSTHDVVVVSINYRLSVFGFLYDGSGEAPGNMGHWDQALALKWVRDNIRSFGGNPEAITIFGESAGSVSVGVMMVSPVTRGMFKRAIMQSGAPYAQWSRATIKYEEITKISIESGKKLSAKVGCHGERWLQCLKTVDAHTLNSAMDSTQRASFPEIWGDTLMPISANAALQRGDINHGIDLIAGVTENEGSIFVRGFFPEFSDISHVNFTKDHLKTLMKEKLFTTLISSPHTEFNYEALFDYYLKPIDENDQTQLKRAFSLMYGDYLINCPTYFFAKDFASRSPNDHIFFYYLTHKTGKERNYDPACADPWMGVCHGEDIRSVFLDARKSLDWFAEIDVSFGEDIKQLWTNFANTGNLMSPAKFNFTISWPSFRDNELKTVVPKAFELNPHKMADIHTELFKSNCDGLWRPYF